MRQTYPEMIRFRAPKDFSSFIAEAASDNYQTISDFMRQLVLAEIGKRSAGQSGRRAASPTPPPSVAPAMSGAPTTSFG